MSDSEATKEIYAKAEGVTLDKHDPEVMLDSLQKDIATVLTIHDEKEAKAYLEKIKLENEEIAKLSPEERKLRKQKQLAENFEIMDRLWKSFGREQKRSMIPKKQKYSARIKKRLK